MFKSKKKCPKTYLSRHSVTDVDEGSGSDAVVAVEGLDPLLLGTEAIEDGLRVGPHLNVQKGLKNCDLQGDSSRVANDHDSIA